MYWKSLTQSWDNDDRSSICNKTLHVVLISNPAWSRSSPGVLLNYNWRYLFKHLWSYSNNIIVFLFHLFLLAGGKLPYNTAVVSAMHWHESAMDWHVLPIPIPPPHPIPLGLPSAPALSTCLVHPTCTGDLFHTW